MENLVEAVGAILSSSTSKKYGQLVTLYNTKTNQRLYGKSVNSLAKENDLDTSMLSKLKHGKRKSYKGFDKVLESEVLYSGLDTLVFTYNSKVENEFKGYDFLELYKAEARKLGVYPFEIGELKFQMKSKSFGFYNFQFTYEDMFLIALSKDKIYIKVLAKAFYLYDLEEIRDSLDGIVRTMFYHRLNDFKVSELHYAIDVKFPFKVLEFYKNGDYKNKFHTLNKWGKYRSDGQVYYDNYTMTNGAIQIQLYEKAIESFYSKDKDKREIFFKNFGFDSVFDYEDYLKTNSQIVRFEYRLKNKTGYLNNYPMLFPTNCFDLQVCRGVLWVVWSKHSSLNTAENKILELIFGDMKEVTYEKQDIESCYEKQLENIIKAVKGYITSYHVKKEFVHDSEFTLNEIMQLLEKDLENSFYYDSLEKKRIKLNL